MGWTSYPISWCAQKGGKVDRKAEVDKVYSGENEARRWTVMKSTMVGSTWYGAVKVEKKESGESHVFGGVCLTSVERGEFWYKDMDETVGPCQCDCPKSILKMLSPTESEWANKWRERCAENYERNHGGNSLSKLPIGTVIEVVLSGDKIRLTKHCPAYQFKTAFWMTEDGRYLSKKRIPREFRVIV